jgi:hypothetical protein
VDEADLVDVLSKSDDIERPVLGDARLSAENAIQNQDCCLPAAALNLFHRRFLQGYFIGCRP